MNYILVFLKRVPKMLTGGGMDYDTEVTGNALFSFDSVNEMLSGNTDMDGLEGAQLEVYGTGATVSTKRERPLEMLGDSPGLPQAALPEESDEEMATRLARINAAAKSKQINPKKDLSLLQGIDKMKVGGIYEAIGDAASAGLNAIDLSLMGNKNFDADSKAKDVAADSLAKVASKFGPWGLLAAGVIKTANFLDKGFGGTVQGYDAQLSNSGYGTLGTQEETSGRLLDRMSGKTQALLRRRNEQAQLAIRAKAISDDVKFEQEARANSVDNVIQNNQIALSGGINSSLLAAKKGAKLTKLKQTITRAQYGAKLKKVEISEEKSLLPEGDLHKNKHDKFDIPVTEKGIPVVHLANGAEVQTLEDLQEHKEHVVQDAEIETNEVIFSKELTDYVEEARKKWHDGDDSILLEVGKRVTKELLHNTMDNTGLIRKLRAEDGRLVH